MNVYRSVYISIKKILIRFSKRFRCQRLYLLANSSRLRATSVPAISFHTVRYLGQNVYNFWKSYLIVSLGRRPSFLGFEAAHYRTIGSTKRDPLWFLYPDDKLAYPFVLCSKSPRIPIVPVVSRISRFNFSVFEGKFELRNGIVFARQDSRRGSRGEKIFILERLRREIATY